VPGDCFKGAGTWPYHFKSFLSGLVFLRWASAGELVSSVMV